MPNNQAVAHTKGQRMWHFLVAIMVVILLMFLFMMRTSSNDVKWQRTSAQGLYNKVQTGLSQVFWLWQQQGRPAYVLYKPQYAAKTYRIDMDNKGIPQIERSAKGCMAILALFVEKDFVENHFKVSIQRMKQGSSAMVPYTELSPVNDISNADSDRGVMHVLCKYEFYDFIFTYNIKNGEFRRHVFRATTVE